MRRTIAFASLVAGVMLVGCNDQPTQTGSTGTPAKSEPTQSKRVGKHSGWWCVEHGIPEEECLMCLHSEEKLKKDGNWCEHDYAKSQCFACNPKLKERYAVQYKAKYGKEPPEPTDNPPGKNLEK